MRVAKTSRFTIPFLAPLGMSCHTTSNGSPDWSNPKLFLNAKQTISAFASLNNSAKIAIFYCLEDVQYHNDTLWKNYRRNTK